MKRFEDGNAKAAKPTERNISFARFAGFAFLLGALVQELAEVHDPAYGRVGVGRYFDEVHPPLRRDVQGFPQRNNPQVFVFVFRSRNDQTNLADPANLLVNSIISGADTAHLTFQKSNALSTRSYPARKWLIVA